MQQPPQEARPRHRSAFAAAFLSLLFPGLGHAYAGAFNRALGFAAIPTLALALLGGIALSSGIQVFALELAANLPLILIANLILLAYRVAAAVDAYRVAAYLNAIDASGGGRFGRPSLRVQPLSLAGLLAVCLVIAGGHAVFAYYGAEAQSTLSCIFDPSGTNQCDQASDAPGPSDEASLQPGDSPTAPATSAPPLGSELPTATLPDWNGNDRLNILLIGADQRPKEGTFNTDTLIVVSIDPNTKQVAMFSLPRDTIDVPIPAGPARSVFGSSYANRINSLWTNSRFRSDAFPGNDNNRGFNALKSVLSELYGLDIQYYVMVNFEGFKDIVDTLGGVTINVQIPVVDDHYPGGPAGASIRVYIPTGVQHMTGAQALVYARSRHTSQGGDFDRAQRQQRVILSIREQADPAKVLANLTQLLTDLKKSFKTDIPQSKLPQLIGLSSKIDSSAIRSFVFSPPHYGNNAINSLGSVVEPDIGAIRQAVANAFKKIDPVIQRQREAVAGEDGFIWVVNGSGKVGQASSIAAYLEYLGLTASAPTKRPDTIVQQTLIRVYNGRESDLQATIALLENVFNVKATYLTDPSVTVDVIVTTGTKTADLSAPPAP